MKDKFPEEVEKWRVGSGAFASKTGDLEGCFIIKLAKNGTSFTIIVSRGMGWDHVSVSTGHRCPTWDEMCQVKDLFFDKTETAIQYHPQESEYINFHPYCLHLWRPQNVELPIPDSIMVGFKS